MVRNTIELDNTTSQALAALEGLLPVGWSLKPRRRGRLGGYEPDAVIEVRAPDRTKGLLVIEVKSRLSTRDATDLGPRLLAVAGAMGDAVAVVVAPFLSELTRARLKESGVGYWDRTGNAWISLNRPGLTILTQGAAKDPDPPERGLRSLKGAKAARLVRALCDWCPPVGVRELAGRAGTDAGYASRVIRFLEDEDLLGRGEGGQVETTSWQGLLRRWSRDYDVARANGATAYLAPRGLAKFADRLRAYDQRYAVTGSLAVPRAAAVAPARLASCYVDNVERAAKALDLRPADVGANVLVLTPFDPVVYDRGRTENDLCLVALSQCVVDMLSGSGREPSEAESLMSWMAENEGRWRV